MILHGQALTAATLALLVARGPMLAAPDELPSSASGGALTVTRTDRSALYATAVSFAPALAARRARGEAFVNSAFVPAPSTAHSRDGLGPLFNSSSCESCHRDLRRAPALEHAGVAPTSLVIQLSVPAADGTMAAHPDYGEELNVDALRGVTPEAQVHVRYTMRHGQYADDSAWTLRVPDYRFER